MSGMQLIDDLDRPAASLTEARRGNWVVAPIPFRNELLGAGLVLGAGYLYGARDANREARHSVAAIGGMYAERGSWAAIAGHRGYWAREKYRTTLGLAEGEILYDIELDVAGRSGTVSLTQKFSGATVDAAAKVGASGWLGAGFVYGTTDIAIRRSDIETPDDFPPSSRIDVANLRLSGELDDRDNDLYPHTGRYGRMQALIAREEFGSDDDYETLELEWNSYRALSDAHVLAWRIAGKFVGGDAPFFAMAWFGSGTDLRGYTPGRYIGDSMIAAQAEWRWQATRRWGFVGFGGAGKVSGALGDIDTDQWLPAGGVGVRFRLTKSLPLNMRADFAWGRDDCTFNLAIGEAF
jgi:hypothetical protein